MRGEAEPLLRREIAAHPDAVDPMLALARVREARGDDAGGAKLRDQFAAAHPTSTFAIIRKASALPAAEQVPAFETAVAAHPSDAELVFALAAVVQSAGDLDRASQLFEHAAELAPTNAAIRALTARFFLKAVDQPARALPFYYRAYFLDPNFYETELIEARIHRLMDQTKLAGC